MRKDLAISATAHVAILAWGVLSFAATPYKVDVTEALPIDIISSFDFSQMTAGTKTGTQSDKAKPLAEMIGEHKPADDQTAKIVPKNEVKATSEVPPPPLPKPPQPAPKAQPQPKRDLIAEAIKKEEAKKPDTKQVEAKTPVPPKKPPPPAVPAFDPNQVMALLDKRAPQRQAATSETLSDTPPIGLAKGTATQISQGELDGLRRRLIECWNPPVGAADVEKLHVVLRVLFNPDGTVARPPALVEGTLSPLGPATAESAKRAILRCQPFNMLKPEHYEEWKDIEITFDPREMFRG